MNKIPGWREARLKDLVFFQRGFDITKAQQKPGDIPVISSSGIKSYHSEAKVKSPGVVIGRKGTLGSVFLMDRNYWPHDTTLWSKKLNGNNPKFIYHFLKTLNLERYDVGNSNPTLNRNHIHELEILIPPVEIQDKIAEILSAYDDLIENNRRRIQLLEQSARLLYKEWFVYLRFPGHEHVAINNSIPDGWEKKPLREAGFLNYGKALKADDRIPGSFPVYGSSGIVGTHHKALVKGPAIIVGRKGNVGSVFWSNSDFYPIDTVFFIDAESSDYYLYYTLLNTRFINTDVAVPGLNRDFAHSREILFPKKQLHTLFEDMVKPLHQQMTVLLRQCEALEQARALLLPRLMNGAIAV